MTVASGQVRLTRYDPNGDRVVVRRLGRIGAEIYALLAREYAQAVFPDDAWIDLQEPGFFLDPEPDVRERAGQPGTLGVIGEHPVLPGAYMRMQSPGSVVRIGRILGRFYWSMIGRLRRGFPNPTPLDLEGTLQLVVNKTYEHERFQFHCDVMRRFLGGQYDPLREEALAVACARPRIQALALNSKAKRMNRVLYHQLLDAGSPYRAPVFRDRPYFADDSRFQPALLDYLPAPAAGRLQHNGVDILRE